MTTNGVVRARADELAVMARRADLRRLPSLARALTNLSVQASALGGVVALDTRSEEERATDAHEAVAAKPARRPVRRRR